MPVLRQQNPLQRAQDNHKNKSTMKYKVMLTANASLYYLFKAEETEAKRLALHINKSGKQTIITAAADDATALKAITTSVAKLIGIAENKIWQKTKNHNNM
jgi:tRNA threonylcarbamoyladenosine modification (KEOPS) complex  Pcc1 subunit